MRKLSNAVLQSIKIQIKYNVRGLDLYTDRNCDLSKNIVRIVINKKTGTHKAHLSKALVDKTICQKFLRYS